MDIGKRNQLVARLSQEPEPQIVPIEVFFDGNDDLGSIGCNLLDHRVSQHFGTRSRASRGGQVW